MRWLVGVGFLAGCSGPETKRAEAPRDPVAPIAGSLLAGTSKWPEPVNDPLRMYSVKAELEGRPIVVDLISACGDTVAGLSVERTFTRQPADMTDAEASAPLDLSAVQENLRSYAAINHATSYWSHDPAREAVDLGATLLARSEKQGFVVRHSIGGTPGEAETLIEPMMRKSPERRLEAVPKHMRDQKLDYAVMRRGDAFLSVHLAAGAIHRAFHIKCHGTPVKSCSVELQEFIETCTSPAGMRIMSITLDRGGFGG